MSKETGQWEEREPESDAWGSFFPREKKGENWPDFTGNIVFSGALLRHMVDLYKAGKLVKVDMAGWRKTGNKGGDYVRFKLQELREREDRPDPAKQDFNDFGSNTQVNKSNRVDPDLNDDPPF